MLRTAEAAEEVTVEIMPRVFSLKSYQSILSDKAVYTAAFISAAKTILTTLLNLFWTGMLAYALSRREYVLRKLITTVLVKDGTDDNDTHTMLLIKDVHADSNWLFFPYYHRGRMKNNRKTAQTKPV